ATIASTDIRLLLRDDIFVDFFNTFLNLPVFGQIPIYISSMGQWDLCPELPSHLDPSPRALLVWLEKHRLPHFCKSSLCLHFILCQKLLGFIRSGEAAKLLNWHSADRWLLEKCISGSQGMRHFCTFVQGTAGEELTNFWLTTERLLGLDESDARQREFYLSLLHRLKATHLCEGSSVVTLCRTIVGPLLKAEHVQPISTRREILSRMQEQALITIQGYWLPKFFIHCKIGMEEEKSCQPLLQEYRERLLWDSSQEPSGFVENLFKMRIKRRQGLSEPYCSKKAKAEIWTLVKEGRNPQEVKMPIFQVQTERQPGLAGSTKESHLDKDALGLIPQQSEHPANTSFGDKGGATSPKSPRSKAEQILHPEDLCEDKVLSNLHSSAPLVQLASLKNPVQTLSFLPWVLSADCCAGRPFRDFLKHQGRSVEAHLLDLWHDLEEFLPVVLDPSRENSFFLRHLLGKKICKTYLGEGTIQQLPLETRTLRSLQDHLMSGEFSPRITRAQKEICEVLCCFYEEFLADDDKTFLQFMSQRSDALMPEMQGHAVGRDKYFLLSQQINGSLKLSQALHGTRNLEGLSSEHWQAIGTRDLRKGGSIQAEEQMLELSPLLSDADSWKMMGKEMAVQKPLLAVDSPRKKKELPCLKSPPAAIEPENREESPAPVREIKSSAMKSTTAPVEKPSRRPRHFVKVLHSPAHLQFFKQFLKERNADEPLHFWIGVEKLVAETNPQRRRSLVKSIVRNYFHAEIPPEELLDCCSSIIKDIKEAKVVNPYMLMTAQVFVQKAMEKRWFKEYQDLFPPCDTLMSNLRLKYGTGSFMADKVSWAWRALCNIIRRICKFHRDIGNDKHCVEFQNFLRHELENKEESMA
ncbi:RGSL protein, partial [Pterocles burchelli]|nr:RGSL protein [Pterocles burchelli]